MAGYKNRNRRLPALALVALAAIALSVPAALTQEPRRSSAGTVMRVKLLGSQEIVEGLTTNNYDKIVASAERLKLLSFEAAWAVVQTKEYQELSRDFRRATDQLKKESEERNLDGATLAYMNLTARCVTCHKYLRDHVPDPGR